MFVISANINLHIADILKPSFFDLFAKNYFTISQKNRISFLKIIRIRKVLGLMFVISANINMLIAVILSPKSSRYDFPELRFFRDFTLILWGEEPGFCGAHEFFYFYFFTMMF